MKNIDVNEYKKDMITEDYVSFEIAKLLKKKGFDSEDCFAFYKKNGEIGFLQTFGDIADYDTETDVIAPTLQMAMKWLREKYNIFLNVGFGADYTGDFLFMADIYDLTNDSIDGRYIPIVNADDYLTENPKSYEEAVEAALKYCLENLV